MTSRVNRKRSRKKKPLYESTNEQLSSPEACSTPNISVSKKQRKQRDSLYGFSTLGSSPVLSPVTNTTPTSDLTFDSPHDIPKPEHIPHVISLKKLAKYDLPSSPVIVKQVKPQRKTKEQVK